MRRGGGKGKGSAYEREVCKRLSLWVSGGKSTDLFWRSAMSGGRATVAHRKGQKVRQSGDITAVAPEGHALTDFYFLECKFYKDLDLAAFFLTGKGRLAKFWTTAVREAKKHKKKPILIARQNRMPDLFLAQPLTIAHHLRGGLPKGPEIRVKHPKLDKCTVWYFDELLKVPFTSGG